MTEQKPYIPDTLLLKLIDGGSLASLAEFAADPWLKLRLRSTVTKERMFPTYVRAQVIAYILRDRFHYKPFAREKFLHRHVLPRSKKIAAEIGALYYNDAVKDAADALYAQLNDDRDAMEAIVAEIRPLIDQP